MDLRLFLTLTEAFQKFLACKRYKGHNRLPKKKKENLLAQLNVTKGRVLHNICPYRSSAKDNHDQIVEGQESDKDEKSKLGLGPN